VKTPAADVARIAADLDAMLADADDLQWLATRPPVDLDDRTDADDRKASRVRPPDPTADTATDPARRALREAVERADLAARRAHLALSVAAANLRHALSRVRLDDGD
jgi:hypothetical protein